MYRNRIIRKPYLITGKNTMETLVQLEQRLKELKAAIDEINQRLPAHSLKPAHIGNLFDLEDEYDQVVRAIETLKSNTP